VKLTIDIILTRRLSVSGVLPVLPLRLCGADGDIFMFRLSYCVSFCNFRIIAYIHTYIHTHVRTYIHTHTHIYTCTHVHTYTYIHTYTHTHINTHRCACAYTYNKVAQLHIGYHLPATSQCPINSEVLS
jgi:hypothetical protein